MGSRFKVAYTLLAPLVLVVVIALALRGTGEDERVQLVLDTLVDADYCVGVVVPSSSPDASWPHAAVDELVECGHAGPGPGVRYARFTSGQQLRENLLADPPAAQVCIAGREVLVDFLDGEQFAPLCRRFSGEVVTGKREGLRRFWQLN